MNNKFYSVFTVITAICLLFFNGFVSFAVADDSAAGRDKKASKKISTGQSIGPIQLGPRPYFLIDAMGDSKLKDELQACTNKRAFKRKDFSIGHRGAPLQFPEHTRESYQAAARMGAGIIECDVTFTKDKALVCRHSQCDLHTTTNILATSLAENCSEGFTPAVYDNDGSLLTPASAKCCTSDISLAEFKSLQGKMDASNPAASNVDEYMFATASWRTDLYSSRGTLMTHAESIELFRQLGVKYTPELKGPAVAMPFAGFSQQDFAQKLVDEYKAAGVPPRKVWAQSFDVNDVLYWLNNEPEFGQQGVYLDGRYDEPGFDHRNSSTWSPTMDELAAQGVKIIAPPMWMLLAVDGDDIVPSTYAIAAREAGLDIITWTLERSGPLADGGGWYYQTVEELIEKDGDTLLVLDVLAQDVGVIGVFADWPATVTFYANCMGLE